MPAALRDGAPAEASSGWEVRGQRERIAQRDFGSALHPTFDLKKPMNDSVSVRNESGGLTPEHRMKAAQDLVRRIPDRAPRRIADVYSGRGSMRALLARRFPSAEIESFDLSQSIDRGQGARDPFLSAKRNFDLICSNGSLEMAPLVRRLLPTFVNMVAAGGCLAIEFPNDLYEPSRALMRMIAADGPWSKTLLPIAKTRPFNETMEGLYALLSPICAAVDIWEVTYLHAMAGVAAIIEWMEATSLTPFLTALDEANRRKFLDRYAAELRLAYPALPGGQVLLRSRRLFILAQP
jgi:trans-aconitate 2-methyltransferase